MREALVVKAARAADIIPGAGESRDESVAGLGCVGRVERVDECCTGGDREPKNVDVFAFANWQCTSVSGAKEGRR